MISNNVTSNNSTNTALHSGAAAQHPPLLPRTETQPETLRPVAPTQTQNSTDRVSISNQARSLAANGNEESYAKQAEQHRQQDEAGRALNSRVTAGAAQYRAVLKTQGTS